jgi:hypothetical protein
VGSAFTGASRDLRQSTLRVVLPPLAITAGLLTAATLLLIAATIVPPPLPAAVASQSALTEDAGSLPSPISDTDAPLQDITTTQLAPNAQVTLPPVPCVVELTRLTYVPGSDGASPRLPGPLLLTIESGALTMQLRGVGTLLHADEPARVVEGDLTLHVSDGLVLPSGTVFAFHNGGTTPVVALVAGVFSTAKPVRTPARTVSAQWDQSWSPGAIVQPLASGWLIDPPTGPTTFELRRLNLQPGANTPLSSPGAMILSVEAGALTLLSSQGLVWQQSLAVSNGWIDQENPATLLPSEGALLQDRPTVTLGNESSGPLLLLVLTVAAVDTGVSGEGSPMQFT